MHRQFHGNDKGGSGGGGGGTNEAAANCYYSDNDIMGKGISFNVRVSCLLFTTSFSGFTLSPSFYLFIV